MSASEEIYQELILQHSRKPRHFGTLSDATHLVHADNPLCGDSYRVMLRVDADGIIREAAFEGTGCAISKSSASMLLDMLIGRTKEEFATLLVQFQALVKGEPPLPVALQQLGKTAAFGNIWKYPARVKCAILCWHAVERALQGEGQLSPA